MTTLEPLTDPTGANGCPVSECLSLIGGKWKPVILYCVGHGANRFGILRKVIPGISKQVLTRQLRELERDGILSRTVNPGRVVTVDYALTERGCSLGPVVEAMKIWGLAERANRITPVAE